MALSPPQPISQAIKDFGCLIKQSQRLFITFLASPHIRQATLNSRPPSPIVYAVQKLNGTQEIPLGLYVTPLTTAQVTDTMQERTM